MTRQDDLFGAAKVPPRDRKADARKVVIRLEYQGETDDAWLLAKKGFKGRWIPKAGCVRGEAPDLDSWTMSAGWARDRAWL